MHRPPVSRSAVPAPKATPAIITPTDSAAIAMLEAVTASTLAAFYLKRDNIAGARRKLRQALQALNALETVHDFNAAQVLATAATRISALLEAAQ